MERTGRPFPSPGRALSPGRPHGEDVKGCVCRSRALRILEKARQRLLRRGTYQVFETIEGELQYLVAWLFSDLFSSTVFSIYTWCCPAGVHQFAVTQ